MKTKEFYVPTDSIIEFAEMLGESDLTHEIKGVTEDDEVIIEVEYEKEQGAAVLELIEMLDGQEED
jgi:hypothetical protein